MKVKKVLLGMTVIILVLMLLIPTVTVYAEPREPLNPPIELKVYAANVDGDGYAIRHKVGNEQEPSKAIWDIRLQSGSSTEFDPNSRVFCLNSEIGFAQGEDTYNYYYDMKKDEASVKALSSMAGTIKNIESADHSQILIYNAILALGDMVYIPGKSSDADREALLNKVIELSKNNDDYAYGNPYWNQMAQNPLTDYEIYSVEQAAFWYFSNYYKNESNEREIKFDNIDNPEWLFYNDYNTYPGGNHYTQFSEIQPVRNAQAYVLYKYLINSAIENAKGYSTDTGAPATVATTQLDYIESGDNYIIGPIRINEKAKTIVPYTIDFVVKNDGTVVENPMLLNSTNPDDRVPGTRTVKDLVGQDFYILMPKSAVTHLTVDFDIKYTASTLILWTHSTAESDRQPVLVPKKYSNSVQIPLTLYPESKPFDLALRKYITKVNGVDVTNTRVPNIDETTLSSGTTATYKHRKDPYTIQTGDIVTYDITIYNEGQKDGRATKIVDQLPAGLKFNRVVSGNFIADSTYSEDGDNKLILNRKASDTTNLPAYTTGKPSFETITIECEVTATPDSKNQKILTNIAWISEAFDAVDGRPYSGSDIGYDRDSAPGAHPNYNKDNMSNYKGHSENKENLSDSAFFYKGEQDDDDFEKLVLEPETFDLRLIKNIVNINEKSVTERLKGIDVSKLNVASNSEKTAIYNMDKNLVSVAKGDIITYRLRVYNEGTLDGYASEITEDIPEGLEFLWSEKEGTELSSDTTLTEAEKEAIAFNQQYLWGNFVYNENKDKIIQISSDYLSRNHEAVEGDGSNLIKAFGKNDGSKTSDDLSSKEVFVKMKVVSDNVTGITIRNEACISKDSDKDGNEIDDRDSDPDEWVKYEDDEDYDNIILKPFDLALRKFIIAVSEDETIQNSEYLKDANGNYTRAPKVDTTKLNTMDSTTGKLITTATYNHTKEPVEVKKGDIVVYMLRVYNEGDIDGYATEIKDHLPSNLEYVDGEFNRQRGWSVSEDGRTVTTKYLENEKIAAASFIIGGITAEGPVEGWQPYILSYKEVPIMCRVKNTAKVDEKITNIADITEFKDENKQTVVDRDSQEDNVNATEGNKPEYKDTEINRGDTYIPGQQDDDDFEKVVVPAKVDLALTKFITAISEDDKIEDGEYLSKDKTSKDAGSATNPYDRQTKVDTRELRDNDECHDATYIQDKTPLVVGINSYVLYNIRVYNEGEVDVYAGEVTDFLPENLEFVEGEFNSRYGWTANGRTVKTSYLSSENGTDKILKAFDKENDDGNASGLDYKDLPILCKVNSKTPSGRKLINTAEITKYEDKDGNNLPEDIDSTPNNVNPKNKEQRQEDDDDYEVVLVKKVDIALTKFITAISNDSNIEDGEYLTKDTTSKNAGSAENPYDRQTAVDTKELRDNDECHDAKYIQDKTPIIVGRDSYVLYNIRVYNEGSEDLYAGEVTDFLPENLEFVDGEFNKQYGWTAEGRTVKTSYLSSKNGEDKILKAFDKSSDDGKGSGLDYKDLPILCKVNSKTPANKELINTAEITKYEDEDGKDLPKDIDSIPNNVVTKNDKDREEDDDDYEVVVVKEFDLALRKWVTQAIVIDSKGQTVTETGHQPYDDPEQVVKVELHRKKLNEVTVKFRYSIRVINEGDIAGYAKEVTDYIPQGLKFVAEDNKGWTDEGNNVISTTLLENTLLQPGEFADVEVLLTWINNENNMGVMVNTAEISKDYNIYGVPDRDSIPDNKKPGEDDIDDAPVMLSISTGQMRIYFVLGFAVLITIAGGVVLIKKYVL